MSFIGRAAPMQIELKYGLNPHQKPARLITPGDPGPLEILSGTPGYINLLDAFGAWQLARELKQATGKPGAASFKHVSPAGAAVARPLTPELRHSQMLPDDDFSPVATAYIRARAGDRMCSFGDVAAVSDTVDMSLAKILSMEVSDLIVAPDYKPQALDLLKKKKKGAFICLKIDPSFEPPAVERREVFGFTLEQKHNDAAITPELFTRDVVSKKKTLPPAIVETLVVATIALKYTQSNSVGLAYDGQVIGMGAGQQSRIHCTRLACAKAEKWFLQQHPKVLALNYKDGLGRPEKTNIVDQYLLWDELSDTEKAATLAGLREAPEPIMPDERRQWIARFDGICLSSDAFIPFRDNIDRASRANVQYIAQPGQSLRDEGVTEAADQYGMVMVHTGVRCFLH